MAEVGAAAGSYGCTRAPCKIRYTQYQFDIMWRILQAGMRKVLEPMAAAALSAQAAMQCGRGAGRTVSSALRICASCNVDRGQLALALRQLRVCMTLVLRDSPPHFGGQASVWHVLGRLYQRAGAPDAAVEHWLRGLRCARAGRYCLYDTSCKCVRPCDMLCICSVYLRHSPGARAAGGDPLLTAYCIRDVLACASASSSSSDCNKLPAPNGQEAPPGKILCMTMA